MEVEIAKRFVVPPLLPARENRAKGEVVPIPTDPEKSAVPATDNLFDGLLVPMPTLPAPVCKSKLAAALIVKGEYCPEVTALPVPEPVRVKS